MLHRKLVYSEQGHLAKLAGSTVATQSPMTSEHGNTNTTMDELAVQVGYAEKCTIFFWFQSQPIGSKTTRPKFINDRLTYSPAQICRQRSQNKTASQDLF